MKSDAKIKTIRIMHQSLNFAHITYRDFTGMRGVDVSQLVLNQVADHLLRRSEAVVQQAMHDLHGANAEGGEARKLHRLGLLDHPLHLLQYFEREKRMS
jgi:hypothetical protein